MGGRNLVFEGCEVSSKEANGTVLVMVIMARNDLPIEEEEIPTCMSSEKVDPLINTGPPVDAW